jgi:acetyl/propionyl-CoA carboxylase alpha subunit
MVDVTRVLIANRGEMARRLIKHFKGLDIETVVVFSESEADYAHLDEADYAVYLNGKTVKDTYLNAQRVLSAAMDAGCDAIHPGYCFLAERVDFFQMAAGANVAVIGCDYQVLPLVVDRFGLREVARQIGIPLIPASAVPDGEDGLATGAQMGVPLFVKARSGGALASVAQLDQLPEAVAQVRLAAEVATGDGTVYLERAVDSVRQIGTIVVADRHGHYLHLGECDGSLQVGYRTWVEEFGATVSDEMHQRLGAAALALARHVGWAGVGTVRWALTPDGGWYLLGFSARLTTGFSLVEQVQGVDLVETQLTTLSGEELKWSQDDAHPTTHGLQLRVFHVDTSDLSRPEGILERMVLPEGVMVEPGVDEGDYCTADTDPLLVKITVVAPTRHAAIVRARVALNELVIEGITHNIEVLKQLLDTDIFWDRKYDARTLADLVAAANG